MNILQLEDRLKGMPDEILVQEAQSPSGSVPQYLVVSEIQRRSDMRKRMQAQAQQPQPTVADQIIQQGIGSIVPSSPRGLPAIGAMSPTPNQPPVQMQEGGIARYRGQGYRTPAQRVYDSFSNWWQNQAEEAARQRNRANDPSSMQREQEEESRMLRAENSIYENLGNQNEVTTLESQMNPETYQASNVGDTSTMSTDIIAPVDAVASESTFIPETQYNPNEVSLERMPVPEDITPILPEIQQSTIMDDLLGIIESGRERREEQIASMQQRLEEQGVEAKKEDINRALISLGAGIASGDLSAGLSQAGQEVFSSKQRQEERRDRQQAMIDQLISQGADREDAMLIARATEGERVRQADMQQALSFARLKNESDIANRQARMDVDKFNANLAASQAELNTTIDQFAATFGLSREELALKDRQLMSELMVQENLNIRALTNARQRIFATLGDDYTFQRQMREAQTEAEKSQIVDNAMTLVLGEYLKQFYEEQGLLDASIEDISFSEIQ